MKTKRFDFHPEARTDLREALEWYRSRNPAAAARLRALVSEAAHRIAQYPNRWPGYLYGTRRFVLQRFPFSIIYLDEPDIVSIVAVAHSKRQAGILERPAVAALSIPGQRCPEMDSANSSRILKFL